MPKTSYKLRSRVWIYSSPHKKSSNAAAMVGARHFITVPKKASAELKKEYGSKRRGWGSIPVTAAIGKTRWMTSIFPDRKLGAYLLPVKAEVRKKENLRDGDAVALTLEVRRSTASASRTRSTFTPASATPSPTRPARATRPNRPRTPGPRRSRSSSGT